MPHFLKIWGPWDAQAAEVFERHEPYQVQVMARRAADSGWYENIK